MIGSCLCDGRVSKVLGQGLRDASSGVWSFELEDRRVKDRVEEIKVHGETFAVLAAGSSRYRVRMRPVASAWHAKPCIPFPHGGDNRRTCPWQGDLGLWGLDRYYFEGEPEPTCVCMC